jgi:tetratricopeptide (TPR) repeat protein
MQHFSNNNDNQPLSKFELMLKTNSVYFFDSSEFEEIILFYVDSGKFSLAKKALHLGLSQHPTSVTLKLMHVELLILDEKLETAEKLLNQLEEIEPSNEDIYIQKATIYSKKGKHQLAVDNLKIALLYADEDAEILSMIGMEYLFLEDFDTARFNFAKSLDVEFENYSSLYNVIYCFDMMKKHSEAIDYLKDYLEKDPYSEIAWHQLGRQYYIVFDYQNALQAFEYSILIDEEFIGAHLEKAKTLEELGHYEEAIRFYHKTMELDTPTSFAYLRIGKCYEKLHATRDAIDFYNKTVNEDPLLDKGWLALTDIYISNKNYHKALFYINKALSIDEENNLYWHKFAEINLKLNLFEEAARAYYKCIGLQDDRMEVYLALADVLHFLGEFHEAVRVLLDAREQYNDQAALCYRLAGLHFLVQKEKEAVFFLEKAFRTDPEYLEVFTELFPSLSETDQVKSVLNRLNGDVDS